MRISDWSSDVCSSDLVEIVVDHEPLPAAVLAFDGAPDAHMAEPGIALFRVRLPGPEAQPDLDRDPLVVDQAEAVLRQIVPVSPASVREYPQIGRAHV